MTGERRCTNRIDQNLNKAPLPLLSVADSTMHAMLIATPQCCIMHPLVMVKDFHTRYQDPRFDYGAVRRAIRRPCYNGAWSFVV